MTPSNLAGALLAATCLTLGGVASGCSSAYEAEPQFWPGDDQLSAGGSSPHAGSDNPAAGSSSIPSGGAVSGGSTSLNPGGTPGIAGTPSAGAPSGGGGMGGAGNTAGIGSDGGAATAGSANTGGSAAAGTANSAGGTGGAGGSANIGGAGGGANIGGSASSANCSLTVKVTTAAAGGRYAPRNIGAVWIADQSGNFVRSLEVWAQRRANHLTLWNAATSKAGVAGSRVDIVSQATLTSHVAHTSTWNCQDYSKKAVPDGNYRVYFEMSDQANNGPNRFETFTKGGAAVTLTPADNNNFKSIQLTFKP